MILLSFDTEEFDVPLENGVDYDPIAQGMDVSRHGTARILDILKAEGVRATFFCTTNFADNAPSLMRRIVDEGHEVAAHGCDHFRPVPADTARCKQRLEELTGTKVTGWRQPRMFPVDTKALRREGYTYNSSLNPAFIPGRYMHLTDPRTPFMQDGLMQIPASVTPWLRFPLFWLAMHTLPMWLYKALCRRTWKHDGHFVTYFHPWEFYPLGEHPEYNLPLIIRHNAGEPMAQRLTDLIRMFKNAGALFVTFTEALHRAPFATTAT